MSIRDDGTTIEVISNLLCAPENRPKTPVFDGCTGEGRPSCTATECMYGVLKQHEALAMENIGVTGDAPRLLATENTQRTPCEHQWGYRGLMMPEGYLKPIAGPVCFKCGQFSLSAQDLSMLPKDTPPPRPKLSVFPLGEPLRHKVPTNTYGRAMRWLYERAGEPLQDASTFEAERLIRDLLAERALHATEKEPQDEEQDRYTEAFNCGWTLGRRWLLEDIRRGLYEDRGIRSDPNWRELPAVRASVGAPERS